MAQQAPEQMDLSHLKEGMIVGRQHDNQIWITFLSETGTADLMVMLGLAQTALDFIRHHRDLTFPSLRYDLLQLAERLVQTEPLQPTGGAVLPAMAARMEGGVRGAE